MRDLAREKDIYYSPVLERYAVELTTLHAIKTAQKVGLPLTVLNISNTQPSLPDLDQCLFFLLLISQLKNNWC